MRKPVLSKVPDVKKPVIPASLKESTKWAFSLQYLKQIKLFGLDRVSNAWFVAVLERLQDLSTHDKESFNSNPVLKQDYRYHIIDWNATSIPIARKDFNWINKDILDNEEDFPFWQFQISKALGRIVGFWNYDSSIFYIVVFDPLHNIQPSKLYNYKISDCRPLDCEFTSLTRAIELVKQKKCNDPNCDVTKALNSLQINTEHIFIFGLDEWASDQLKALLKTKTLTEIIEMGILAQ